MNPPYEPAGYCPKCGYRVDPGRCPECGAEVRRPAKRDPRARRVRIRRFLTRVAALGLVAALACYGGRYAIYRWWPTTHLQRLSKSEGNLAGWAERVLSWRYFKEMERAKARERRILAELAELGEHEWAGSYRDAYSGSHYLILAPDSGFAEYTFADIGVMLRGHGTVARVTDRAIELEPRLLYPESFRRAPADNEMLRIRWGKRHCLVPRDTMDHMYELSDEEPMDVGLFRICLLWRPGDERYPVSGLPEFPDEFRRYLPPEPHYATITDVSVAPLESEFENVREFLIRTTIDKGEQDGIELGMWLDGLFADLPTAVVIEASATTSVAEYTALVIEVSATTSVAEYKTWIDTGRELIAPQVGWQFGIPDDRECEDPQE